MIELYTWGTPNGRKVSIMLEEIGLPYNVHPINIREGEQFTPEFVAINPNSKIPAIIDSDGPDGQPITMFESGAILIYLAGKTGKFLPDTLRARYEVLQWLMFQMGHIGPMLGQAHHFRAYAPEKIEYAIARYTKEANRLYGVLDRRLGESEYLGCDEYSIADIATMPWLRSHERQGVVMTEYPNVKRWFDKLNARPAVQRGLQVLAHVRRPPPDDPKWRENMFGAAQYARH
jgi:GST-like protein